MSRNGGYTMLEVMVALAILATLASLATPSIWRAVRAQERIEVIERFQAELSALPFEARLERRALLFPAGGFGWGHDRLPEGWTIDWKAPLAIGPNGVCSASTFNLVDSEGASTLHGVSAPFCRMHELSSDAQDSR